MAKVNPNTVYSYRSHVGAWADYHLLATWVFVRAGFSQQQLCRRFIITPVTLKKWFREPYKYMSLDVIDQIALLLKLPVSDVRDVVSGVYRNDLPVGVNSLDRSWYESPSDGGSDSLPDSKAA